MEEYRLIKCEKEYAGAVVRIILNSPKANVLEGAMLAEISLALEGLAKDKDVKLIVFEGEGKHFSFGASGPRAHEGQGGHDAQGFSRRVLPTHGNGRSYHGGG